MVYLIIGAILILVGIKIRRTKKPYDQHLFEKERRVSNELDRIDDYYESVDISIRD
jgi:hypothetical protein